MNVRAVASLLLLSLAVQSCRDDDPRPPDVFVDFDRRARLLDSSLPDISSPDTSVPDTSPGDTSVTDATDATDIATDMVAPADVATDTTDAAVDAPSDSNVDVLTDTATD